MISVNELKQAINERLENYLTSRLGEVKTITVSLLEAQNHILAQDIAASPPKSIIHGWFCDCYG